MPAPQEDSVLAALRAFVESQPPRPRPVHPEPGCFCTPCVARDDYLEALAESRAAARRGD